MPNWATNLLQINGPKEEIERFIDHVRTETEEDGKPQVCHLDLNKLCPMPEALDIGDVPSYPDKTKEELQAIADNPEESDWERKRAQTQIKMIENREEFGYSSWYDWRVANWGTKWNVHPPDEWEINSDEEATLFYDSAWSPPLDAIQEGSKLFPELEFTNYSMDAGMGWGNETKIQNGEREEDHGNIDAMPDVAEILGYDPSDYEESEEDRDDDEE